MKVFRYGKGPLSKAAGNAFNKWIHPYSSKVKNLRIPDDPIKEIAGQLEGLTQT